MRPETRKQNIASIKSTLTELHSLTAGKWVSNKELPIAELLNKYLNNNGNLKSFVGKYISDTYLKKDDNGRSFKYTWKNAIIIEDFEYVATFILNRFIEDKKVVSPLPEGRRLRKLEEPKAREFELKNKVYIITMNGTICEAVVSGKFLNLQDITEVKYKVAFKSSNGSLIEEERNPNSIFSTPNEVFDYMRVNIRKFI